MKRFKRLLLKILPFSLLKLIGVLFGYIKSPEKSYSLYGEDLIIKHLCHRLGIQNGYYLDIGCFHPKWISNTHLFHKAGWQGTVCDVDIWKTRPFKIFRPGVQIVTAGILPANSVNGSETLFRFKRFLSEWDTFSNDEANRIKKIWGYDFEAIKVPTLSIDSVLEKIYLDNSRINFLNIDVEGLDDKILATIDFNRFPIDIIAFEDNEQFKGSSEIQLKLASANYSHVASVGGTHIYVLMELLSNGYKL